MMEIVHHRRFPILSVRILGLRASVVKYFLREHRPLTIRHPALQTINTPSQTLDPHVIAY